MQLTNSPSVGRKWFSCRSPSVAHDQNVVKSVIARTEWIPENSAGSEDNFRVISRSLSSGASIEIPLGKSLNALGLNGKRKKWSVSARIGKITTRDCRRVQLNQHLLFQQGGFVSSIEGFQQHLPKHIQPELCRQGRASLRIWR